MTSKYSVKRKDEEVFTSSSKLECEYVAIALGIASHYLEPDTFRIFRGKVCIDEIDTGMSAIKMEQKLRGLKFNRRVPEEITINEVDSFILYKLGKNKGIDDIVDRIYKADLFKDDLREGLPT